MSDGAGEGYLLPRGSIEQWAHAKRIPRSHQFSQTAVPEDKREITAQPSDEFVAPGEICANQ